MLIAKHMNCTLKLQRGFNNPIPDEQS